MTAFFSTNRAGRPCVAYPDGTHDAHPTTESAMSEVRRVNAQIRLINRRAAKQIAMTSLGELSLRKGVTLYILPDFLKSPSVAMPRCEVVRA